MKINSRNKGHSFERLLAKEYRELGFKATTSRYSSREKDDQKVDLCGTEPFNVQAKAYGSFSSAKIIQTLKEMPKDSNYNLAHIKITNKGEIVAMSKSDFYEILKIMKKEELI